MTLVFDTGLIVSVFSSPLPNPQLWNGPTIGFLQAWESFANGGWWHDPNLLSATGDGIEKEEPRAWNGWWNEQIVRLTHELRTSKVDTDHRSGAIGPAEHATEGCAHRAFDRQK